MSLQKGKCVVNKSDNKKIIQTIFVSGLGVIIGYAINFFITPFIVENLGLEAYGFISIANSAVSYAGILTIALTSFIVRYISVSYHENNITEANSYYSSSVSACFILSTILFVISFAISFYIDRFIKVPTYLLNSIRLLFFIVFANFELNILLTPYSSAAYIKNRLDLSGIIKIVAKTIEVFLLILLFRLFNAKVWFVSLGTFLSSNVILILNLIMMRKLTPEIRFSSELVSWSKIIKLVSNGIWNSLNQLGIVLNSGLDLIVSNLMLTGDETGEIAVAKTMEIIFSTLFQTVSQPFHPILLRSYAKGVNEEFIFELKKAMKICGYFGAVAFSGFFALGSLYFKLWLPDENNSLLHLLTLLAVFNTITDSILRPVYFVNTLTVKNKIPCFVTILGGLANVY